MNRVAIALIALVLLACASCSSGSGSDMTQSDRPCLELDPESPPSNSMVVARQGPGSDCDGLIVDLLVTNVSGVGGADFRVWFDPSVVEYVGVVTSTSFLADGDATVVLALENRLPDNVEISLARSGTPIVTDAVGTRLLARIAFGRLVDEGSSTLEFTEARLFDEDVLPVPDVEWAGGLMEVAP
ncbi:MAG: hypothetical protein GY716_09970 [bacterium]|nr:hypothetical protein [bacterium]